MFLQWRINRFWRWFSDNEARYLNFEENRDHLFNILHQKLSKIKSGLVFEFGPLEGYSRKFIISAGGLKRLFPVVKQIVHTAPTDLAYIKVLAFRRPKEVDEVVINGRSLKYDQIKFYHEFSDGKIHLLILHESFDYASIAEDPAIFLMLDSLVGEYKVTMCIGGIATSNIKDVHPSFELLSITELPNIMNEKFG